jgi:glycolate oxidase FAD binding subunit
MTPNAPSRAGISTTAIEEQLRAIVGPDHLRPAGASDAVAGVAAQFVVEPGIEREVAAVLRFADDAGLVVIPRGAGTKSGWGNPPSRADLILSIARVNRIEHAAADLTVIVEAGCTLAYLQTELARSGQRLAVDPLWPATATIGGIVSSNDSGALRLYYGSLRDLIIGSTLALADGTLASSGGRVVKNVAGYDLSKLVTGAMGTLGVITRAIFRLHPLPRATRTLSFQAERAAEMQRLMLAVQDSSLGHAAFEMHFAADAQPVAHILLEGTDAGLASQERRVREMVRPIPVSHVIPEIWTARNESLTANDAGAIAKVSVLPTDVAKITSDLVRIAQEQDLRWKLFAEATGIGWLRFDGAPEALRGVLEELRCEIERGGGSLVVLSQPAGPNRLDAWGKVGDTATLMGTLKRQFDPKGTLNPQRFAGGI